MVHTMLPWASLAQVKFSEFHSIPRNTRKAIASPRLRPRPKSIPERLFFFAASLARYEPMQLASKGKQRPA